DRLLSSITYDPTNQRPAITYKGVSAVEALIFTNYLMYRNVYWHHTVRSANAMFKRGIQDLLAQENCTLKETDFDRATEADLIHRLEEEMVLHHIEQRESMVGRIKRRKLYKVAHMFYPQSDDNQLQDLFRHLYYHPDERHALEFALCEYISKQTHAPLHGDEILLDIPRVGKSPEVDLKVFFQSHIPINKADPLSFDDPQVSLLKDYLLDNFEAQAKVVRIFCDNQPGLRESVNEHAPTFLKAWKYT
ncbi:MAG: hypothetical protein HOH77_07150, partial [Candidatus Latescibacteria bacterium]|nr:hypothetical protein [Candidatus Latescibacterota bacterium]